MAVLLVVLALPASGAASAGRIRKLTEELTLTAEGRRLFLANDPKLVSDKTSFAAACRQVSHAHAESAVLGCYKPGQRGIVLFDVTDERLSGIIEVTAAHEILHAAYEKLGEEERERLRPFLKKGLQANKAAVMRKLKEYRGADSEELWNEVHSILATEIEELPHELETHYSRYFRRRSALIEKFQSYEDEFDSRQKRIAEYDRQIDALQKSLGAKTAEIERSTAELRRLEKRMGELRSDEQTAAYNALVPKFNAVVVAHNKKIREANALAKKHNGIVKARNAIAFETRELVEAIDNRVESR